MLPRFNPQDIKRGFGPGYGSTGGVLETPDLFELSVESAPQTRSVLTAGVQGGCPATGSAP